MKRLGKVLCLIIGGVLGFQGNETVGAYADVYIYSGVTGETYRYTYSDIDAGDETYMYKGETYTYRDIDAGVEITGIRDRDTVQKINIPREINGRQVTSIGAGAFIYCERLEEIIIPSGVTHIGDGAFIDCERLEEIIIPSGVTHIEAGAFRSCERLEEIIIPSGVTHIGAEAFANCDSLKEIVIPSGVTHIGAGAFMDCDSLEDVKLPQSLERIEDYTFDSCSSLNNVEMGGVSYIGYKAFYACYGLDEIILPENIRLIANYAFGDIPALYVVLPDSNVEIFSKVFDEGANIHVHKFEKGEIKREDRCYIMEKEGKPLKCLECEFEVSHRFVNGKVIGGSKLVAPLIREGKCEVCNMVGRWNDWSYAWVTGIVVVVLFSFVVAIINYMRRMKKN